MLQERQDVEFEISDEKNYIEISMLDRENSGSYSESDWRCNENLVEFSYREEEGNDWGVGINEFISTTDIKRMADCIRNVIYHRERKDHYKCTDDVFRIAIEFYEDSNTYSFSAALIDTLVRDHHIQVTKNDLTEAALEEYITPFFQWEKQYPIIMRSDEANRCSGE